MHKLWRDKESESEKVQMTWLRTYKWSSAELIENPKKGFKISIKMFFQPHKLMYLSPYIKVWVDQSFSPRPPLLCPTLFFSSFFLYFIQQLLSNPFVVSLENTNMNSISLLQISSLSQSLTFLEICRLSPSLRLSPFHSYCLSLLFHHPNSPPFREVLCLCHHCPLLPGW